MNVYACLKRRLSGLTGSHQLATGSGFPGPAAFVGSYDARTSNMQDGGQSTYAGSIAVTVLDRTLVQNVLPGNFRLAQRNDGGATHPVIHMFGHQRELMIVEGGVTRPAGDDEYQEMILLIPFVVRGSGTTWHSFVVRMYLDNLAAVTLGNTIYAYAKILADLSETGPAQDLAQRVTFLTTALFEGEVKLAGPWRPADNPSAMPRWSDLREIFAMPIVGIDDVYGNIVRTVCSYWEWDYANAEIAPATSQHQFFQPFRDHMAAWVQLGQLTSVPEGTFEIRGLQWRLAQQPLACQF